MPEIPISNSQTGCRAVCVQVGRIDHDGLGLGVHNSQALHHAPDTDPSLLPIVQRLVGFIRAGRVPPSQPIAIDENDAAQRPPTINPGLAVAFWKVRLQARRLLIAR